MKTVRCFCAVAVVAALVSPAARGLEAARSLARVANEPVQPTDETNWVSLNPSDVDAAVLDELPLTVQLELQRAERRRGDGHDGPLARDLGRELLRHLDVVAGSGHSG